MRDGSSFECYYSLSILCIYSTISHCNSSHYECIFIEKAEGNISYTNFAHNTAPMNGVLHFNQYCRILVECCIFFENKGASLVYSYISQTDFSGCYFFPLINLGSLSFKGTNFITNEFSDTYMFFSTQYCHADYPYHDPTLSNTAMSTYDCTINTTIMYSPFRSYDDKWHNKCSIQKTKTIEIIFASMGFHALFINAF